MGSTNFSFIGEETIGRQAFGAIAYRHNVGGFHGPLLHDFELLILVICDHTEEKLKIEHCASEGQRYQLLYISSDDLQQWVLSGDNPDVVRCFLQGDIIWDVRGELKPLRGQILEFEKSLREQRRFKEFARFLRKYVEAKQYSQQGYFMDAYSSVLEALQHFARIELIERGVRIENELWEQARPLSTSVSKLYEELVNSSETVEQRVELVLLACEFSVMSKLADCSSLLLRILRSRPEPWSIEELMKNPELIPVKDDLPVVLRKLVYRSLVRETSARWVRGNEHREILYWA
ncbi:hypothetical protein DCC85_18425 [Paenibacillus sp. CAA11]|uniref:nucleotidyltransferase-like protein n=1 Tax=Paenibacillus sp. CAA11 TaxID=1532905 RepID=UPI000D33499F|nr:nucleotidyltransferase-like protein [Paenibacillus sp. CAA11]AWB45951.1 hypothetical protein DCC85_18425 [Paenibacillus sp. CAA11]